jgi:hypothetical protein
MYMLVGVSDNEKCVNDALVSVCMCRCVCVCVCVIAVDLFQVEFRVLV